MNNIIGPFGDQAIAALISALITVLVSYWIFRKGKPKPNIIICEQLSEIQLIRYGLAEELPFLYGSEELKNPWIIRLLLTNIGSTEILEPNIIIKVDESAKILKPRFQINPYREIINSKIDQKSDQEITLKLDYLNPIKPHNETLKIDLICDGIVENLTITGSGKGWSVQFKALKQALRIAFSYAFIGLIILGISTIYLIFSVIKALFSDPNVFNAFNSLWQSNSIKFPIIVFLLSILITSILALIAERQSKIQFFKEILYWFPKSFFRQAINVIFRNQIH